MPVMTRCSFEQRQRFGSSDYRLVECVVHKLIIVIAKTRGLQVPLFKDMFEVIDAKISLACPVPCLPARVGSREFRQQNAASQFRLRRIRLRILGIERWWLRSFILISSLTMKRWFSTIPSASLGVRSPPLRPPGDGSCDDDPSGDLPPAAPGEDCAERSPS